jgi:hypothetical protein
LFLTTAVQLSTSGWTTYIRDYGAFSVTSGVLAGVHSNVNITLAYYVKSASSDVMAAMGKFEEELTAQSLQDSQRTLKPDSDATSGFVN